MKYIEFIGIPGSGKTTLTQQALTILLADNKAAFSKHDARTLAMRQALRQESAFVWQVARFIALFCESRTLSLLWGKTRYNYIIRFLNTYPRFCRQVIECAEQLNPPAWIPGDVVCGENLLDWLFGGVVSYYQAARQALAPDDILLMEEGFCQHAYYLLAFYQGNFDEQRLATYLQLLPKLDMLVVLQPPAEECEKRMNSRQKGVASDILTPLSAQQRLSLLEHRTEVYQKIAAYMETRQIPVLRLDNTDYQTTRAILKQRLREV